MPDAKRLTALIFLVLAVACFGASTASADYSPLPPQPGDFVTVCKNYQYIKTSRGLVWKHIYHEVVLQVAMTTPLCSNGFTIVAQPSTCVVLQESDNVTVTGCDGGGHMGTYSQAASGTDPQSGLPGSDLHSAYHALVTFNAQECFLAIVKWFCITKTVTLHEDFDYLGHHHKYATNS